MSKKDTPAIDCRLEIGDAELKMRVEALGSQVQELIADNTRLIGEAVVMKDQLTKLDIVLLGGLAALDIPTPVEGYAKIGWAFLKDHLRRVRDRMRDLQVSQCTSPLPDSPPCRGIQQELDKVARLTGERDAWKTRTHERETAIRAHEVVLEECESERDAAVAAKERAEEALRWLLLRVKEDCPQQARGTTRLSMACIDAKQVLAAAQDAKPDHIPQPEKMVIKADQLVRDALVLAERLLESYQPIEGLDEGEELSMRRRIRGVVGGELLPYGGENHCCMECGFSEVMDKFRCDHDRLYCPVCGSDDVDHVLEPEHGGPEGEDA